MSVAPMGFRSALVPLQFSSYFLLTSVEIRIERICTMYTKCMNLFIYIKHQITAEHTKVKALAPDIALHPEPFNIGAHFAPNLHHILFYYTYYYAIGISLFSVTIIFYTVPFVCAQVTSSVF